MDVEHKYTRETFFKTVGEVIWQKWIHGRRLVVDFTLKPGVIPGDDTLRRKEIWTDRTSEEIYASGYVDAVGLHDSIVWSFIPIYARINNGVEFPIKEVFPKLKDTAYTINNAALSRAVERFKKAMARAQLTATADWQKLILMGALGVGVIVATKIFGLW